MASLYDITHSWNPFLVCIVYAYAEWISKGDNLFDIIHLFVLTHIVDRMYAESGTVLFCTEANTAMYVKS